MIIVLFGAPGVGKGTQAEILAKTLGMFHLSTGDAFRTAIKNQTEIGMVAKSYVDGGHLVPDDVTAKNVEEAMKTHGVSNGCILDGFPRTRTQAEALDAILSGMGMAVTHVVNLTVDYDTITQRLLARGRADDTEQVINNRLQVYENETAPLIEFYKNRGVLRDVHGLGTVEEVSARILSAVQ